MKAIEAGFLTSYPTVNTSRTEDNILDKLYDKILALHWPASNKNLKYIRIIKREKQMLTYLKQQCDKVGLELRPQTTI